MPAAIDLAIVDQVGLDAEVLHGEHLARAAEAGLHFVGDHDDPVRVADLAETLDELLRGDDEAALALHGLEHDRRHLLGCHARLERPVQLVEVVEGDAVDLRGERPQAGLVGVRLRGEAEREQRAPVEAAVEGDHRRPARIGARELDGVLDGLGARVEEGCLEVAPDGNELEETLGERDVVLVGNDREVGVGEALDLLLRCLDHPRVRVADVEAADAAREVDEGVPVHVRDRGALRLLDRRSAGRRRGAPR